MWSLHPSPTNPTTFNPQEFVPLVDSLVPSPEMVLGSLRSPCGDQEPGVPPAPSSPPTPDVPDPMVDPPGSFS